MSIVSKYPGKTVREYADRESLLPVGGFSGFHTPQFIHGDLMGSLLIALADNTPGIARTSSSRPVKNCAREVKSS